MEIQCSENVLGWHLGKQQFSPDSQQKTKQANVNALNS